MTILYRGLALHGSQKDLQIILNEKERLDALGIGYDYVMCLDGKPVAIVDPITMADVRGTDVEGRFVSAGIKGWNALRSIDGSTAYMEKLTECRAFRYALGYEIGKKPMDCKYSGQPAFKRRRTVGKVRFQ